MDKHENGDKKKEVIVATLKIERKGKERKGQDRKGQDRKGKVVKS